MNGGKEIPKGVCTPLRYADLSQFFRSIFLIGHCNGEKKRDERWARKPAEGGVSATQISIPQSINSDRPKQKS
jgi:hypothetical protein